MKYLGITFDNKLSWKPHIRHTCTKGWNYRLVIDGVILNFFLSVLFYYRFPTLRLELSIGNRQSMVLFFYWISICLYFLTIDFQPCMYKTC